MKITISLDGTIRDIESAWVQFCGTQENLPNDEFSLIALATSEKWLDYKSLIPPRESAEEKINNWYDKNHKIYVLAYPDEYNKKWLKDHFIPYDSIIEFPSIETVDYWISNNFQECLEISCKKEVQQILFFKTHEWNHKEINNNNAYTVPFGAKPSLIKTIINWQQVNLEDAF